MEHLTVSVQAVPSARNIKKSPWLGWGGGSVVESFLSTRLSVPSPANQEKEKKLYIFMWCRKGEEGGNHGSLGKDGQLGASWASQLNTAR